MIESIAFSEWLERYAVFSGIDRKLFLQDQTTLVNNVICTFVYPANKGNDVAVILIDAGEINCSIDNVLLEEAIGRNFENYLMNAPLFLFNKEARRLIIGKDFQFNEIEPESFSILLDALTKQALAWHRKG